METILATDVRILDVIENRLSPDVTISFYGGPSNACGSIMYSYSTFEESAICVRIAKEWVEENISLSIIKTEDGESLIRPSVNLA